MKKFLNIFLLPLLMLAGTSCQDDLLTNPNELEEGSGTLHATVSFVPAEGTVLSAGESRKAESGQLIENISDLTVFVYNAKKELIKIYPQNQLQNLKIASQKQTDYNTDTAIDAGPQAETKTDRATFDIENFPFGQYYMYAVANMGTIADTEANRTRYANVEGLQNVLLKWNETNIAANNQMYGYFTYDDNDSRTSAGFTTATPLIVGSRTLNLHSWLKRAASKLTVVYDGSKLHNDVFVYVRSITLKDIPRYCYLGKTNEPTTVSADSMITNGGVIYYNTNGPITDNKVPGPDYESWMCVTNDTILKGAVDYVAGKPQTHLETHDALYFYENCQGDYKNYPDTAKYNKVQDFSETGFISNKPGDYDYKDNVPYGTYIEVEGFYVSTNPKQVTSGPIKYRFMLGQDTEYDYNALRNCHYKLTLQFIGYGNQSSWHIEYVQDYDEVEIDPTYYVSYSYNTRATFPIRMLGDIQNLDIEIVENNWAPLDSTQNTLTDPNIPGMRDKRYDVPPAYTASSTGYIFDDFRWWRAVYLGAAVNQTIPGYGYGATSYFQQNYTPSQKYYSLQTPWTRDGSRQASYTEDEIKNGAPRQVTPIWAGFITLRPTNANPLPAVENPGYNYNSDRGKIKDSYYSRNENWRTFSKSDLTFSGWTEGTLMSRNVRVDNNPNTDCEIVKAPDGSVTVNLPVWTRPKSFLGISAFTGNNPYEAYMRRAMLKITATFKSKNDGSTIVKTIFKPIYQVRRIINPKGVWRRYNDDHFFKVKLMHRDSPSAKSYSAFNSQGAWKAWIDTQSEGADGFISLSGGITTDTDGAIVGASNTPVEFYINFNGKGINMHSHCAIVKILYHGFTCEHSIYVRQGYNEPLEIVPGEAKWSSYSVYSFPENTPDATSWNPSNPVNSGDYIHGVLTATPMSLGTYFKRGNYADGICVVNNSRTGYGALENSFTTFKLVDNDHPYDRYGNSNRQKAWEDIYGLDFNYSKPDNWGWARIKTEIGSGEYEERRYYRVPSLEDFDAITKQGQYGIGILYSDGAEEPSEDIEVAYQYWDETNDGCDDHNSPAYETTPDDPKNKYGYGGRSGMRGFIVYNPSTANQVFFPIGARGVGRRTVQLISMYSTLMQNAGILRYGALPAPFQNGNNNFRPIAYNNPGNEGAIYWMNRYHDYNSPQEGTIKALGWDMNFFDLNFNGYSGEAMMGSTGGDALPLKLVLDETEVIRQ